MHSAGVKALVSFVMLFLGYFGSLSKAQADYDGSDYGPPKPRSESGKPIPEFRVYENNNVLEGRPCLLFQMDATIIIEPNRQVNRKATVNLPISAQPRGACGSGTDSRIELSWSSFHFSWHFTKSRVSDAWYTDVIGLSFNTSDKALSDLSSQAVNAISPNSVISMRTDEPLTLYLTPIGASYQCNSPPDIKLQDSKKNSRVTIQMHNVRIQPFAEMTSRQYGDPFRCAAEAGRRDDTVPFAVGITFSLVVLGTIGAYAGYRYFKIKKIEYDTVE